MLCYDLMHGVHSCMTVAMGVVTGVHVCVHMCC